MIYFDPSRSSGECCYWYRRFPATPSACHGDNQTSTVSLVCEIEYQPLNNTSNIEVRWYRTRDEESAGITGETLIDGTKYIIIDPPINPQSPIRQYTLGILNFSNSDRGYYWCQLFVNNVPLSPSPYGYIHSLQCTVTLFDVTCAMDSQLCAHDMVLNGRYMALNNGPGTNCSLEQFSIIVPASTTTLLQSATMSTAETVTIPKPSFTTVTVARAATMSQMAATSSIHTIGTVTISSFATTETTIIITSKFPITEVASTMVVVLLLFVLTVIVVSSIVYIKKHKRQSKLTTHT